MITQAAGSAKNLMRRELKAHVRVHGRRAYRQQESHEERIERPSSFFGPASILGGNLMRRELKVGGPGGSWYTKEAL